MKKLSDKTQVAITEKKVIQDNTTAVENGGAKNFIISIQAGIDATPDTSFKNNTILSPLFDCIDQAVFVVADGFTIAEANESFCHIFGYTKQEICCGNAPDIFACDNPLPLQDKKDSVIWKGQHKNGNAVSIAVSCVQIFHTDVLTYNVMTVQPVQQQENKNIPAVEHPENTYKSIFQLSLTAFFLTRSNGQILDANNASCDMFGYTIAEFQQIGLEDIIDTTDSNFNLYLEAKKKEGHTKGTLTGIKKNGFWFTIEVAFSTFSDDDGAEYTSVSMIDISASIKLHRENLLLLNNTEEGFVIVNPDLTIVNFNRKFEAVCHLLFNKKVTLGVSILSTATAGQSSRFKENYVRVFTGEIITDEIEYVLDKKPVTIQYHFKPLYTDATIFAAFVTSLDITQKKKTQEQLTSRNERYKALIDNSHEAVAILTAEGIVTYVSGALYAILGYSAEEIVQKSLFTLVHPDDVAGLQKNWEEILAHQGIFVRNYLCRMQHKNGCWRWMESNFNNLLHYPSVQGIVNNFRDVTERVTAAEKIKISEVNLQSIFENTDEGFVLINADYTIKSCNDIARCNVFTGKEMQPGDNIFTYVEEHRKEFFKTIFIKTMTGESFNYDSLTTNKQTLTPLWVNFNISPVKERGTVIGVTITARDITRQKEKDFKIIQAENLLNQAESIAKAGSIEIDYLTNKCIWSDGFYRILGLEPGSIEPSRENFSRFLHPEDQAEYEKTFFTNLTKESTFTRVEIRIITSRGEEKNILACAQVQYDAGGRPLKIMGVIQDITLQKFEEKQRERIKKLLHSAENIAKIGCAEINIHTGIRIWSDEFYRIIGLEPHSVEPTKEGIVQFLHSDEKDAYLQWVKNGLANKVESQQLETRIITAKGEERNIMAYGSTKYNEIGNPDILTGVIQDITDRKKMEQELKESKEMYQSLFYQNPAAVFAMNLDGHITSANHVLALKAETSGEALLKMHYADFVFREDLPRVKAVFEHTKQGITQAHELRIITAKGNTLHVSVVTMPIIVNKAIIGVYCIATDITKEKKSLRLLNKTLADRQRILDCSFDMICEIDAEGRFIQVSKACEKILGYKPKELIGKKYINFIVEEDRQLSQKAAERVAEIETPLNDFDNRYIKKDGGIVNLSWSARWDKNENYLYCIARDATEKIEQEQALGLSEQRYQQLFNSNPLPLLIFDFTTHHIVEANHSALRKYGYTEKEFLSLTIDALRPDTEILIMNEMLKNESAFSHVSDRIWTHKKKDGELMYMKSIGNIIEYKGHKCVLSLLDDVTGKIKSEDAIRESEEKLSLIMNAALDAIICMDLKGNIIFWNPQAEKIFGWKEGEVLGRSVASVIIPERFRNPHQKGMDKYLKTGDGPALNNMMNLYAIRKNKREFPVEMTIQSIKQKGEEFFCSFIRDVTEQKKAEILKNFERRDKEALINSTDDLIWSVTRDLKLIAGNRAFMKVYKSASGISIKPGDYLLRKDVYSEDMLLIWHEMYYYALSGETIKKEISSGSNPAAAITEWTEVTFNPIYNGKEITGIACYSRNITENKLQKDRLLATNKKLETAQQMAKLGYWEVDLKTNTAFWSDELYRIHGFVKTDQPIALQKISEVIHPDDVKNVVKFYTEALAGKRAYDFEHRIVLNDGTTKVLLQKGTLVYNNLGHAVALEGTTQDITIQKQAEKAVKDSEEKYRMIFNCNPLPNWIYDLETLQIMEVNDAAITHYGYTGAGFLNMTIKELFTPDQVDAVIRLNKEINNYGIVNFGQWQHLTKSGICLDVDITGHSIFYNNRNAVMITSNDITGIIQSRKALIKSIERFEYATKATSDAIWDCDLADNTVFWGEGFNTLFGYKMKEPRPGFQSWQTFIHPDEREAMVSSINALIADIDKNYWQGEYRFRKYDGSYANVSDCALIIRDNNGTPYRIIGAMQDISKRIQNEIILKELNEQLNKRAAELASSNAELEQFAYIASHDLQEPLRMVTSFLNQLQKKYEAKLDDTGRTYIGFAVDGAVRMRKIIMDLLEYSRVGWQKYHFEKIDMNRLLTEVAGMYNSNTEHKTTRIVWKDMPEIVAAKIPLQQLFQNLIGNAIKYQQLDNIPEITISATTLNDCWQFAVADNGIGIDAEYFDRIFVIFQRLHNKNEYSGTGIGLAICKKIVDNHSGKIWVTSEPLKGSTFYFTISKHAADMQPAINDNLTR